MPSPSLSSCGRGEGAQLRVRGILGKKASVARACAEGFAVSVLGTQVGQYLAKLLFGEDGFLGVVASVAVEEPLAFGGEECHAEGYVLLEECVVGTAQEGTVFVALAAYWLSLPPEALVALPVAGGASACLASFESTEVALGLGIVLFQCLQKTFHAAAFNAVDGEFVALDVRQHVGRVVAAGTDVHGFAEVDEEFDVDLFVEFHCVIAFHGGCLLFCGLDGCGNVLNGVGSACCPWR